MNSFFDWYYSLIHLKHLWLKVFKGIFEQGQRFWCKDVMTVTTHACKLGSMTPSNFANFSNTDHLYSRVSNKRVWSIKRVWWKSTIGHPSCSYLISVYSGFFENSLHVSNIATFRHQVQCAYEFWFSQVSCSFWFCSMYWASFLAVISIF